MKGVVSCMLVAVCHCIHALPPEQFSWENGMLCEMDPLLGTPEEHLRMLEEKTIGGERPTMYRAGDFVAYYVHGMPQSELEEYGRMPEILSMEPIKPSYRMADQCDNQMLPSDGLLWNLERVSKRTRAAFNGTYLFGRTLANDDPMIDLYIIDTGVDTTNVDFGGRAVFGADVTGEAALTSPHGTNSAGLAGSTSYGTSKQARIISVKALAGADGLGNTRITMDALQYVVDDVQRNRNARSDRQTVVNMSLGGPRSVTLNRMVNAMVDALNIHVVVSAGNENLDACEASPASAALAITVGATDVSDQRADFSNFGACVDLFAPGENIVTTGLNDAPQRVSGTSFSAPMVSGLLVNLLAARPGISARAAAQLLIDTAVVGAIRDAGPNSPNRMAFQDCTTLTGQDRATGETFVIDTRHLSGTLGGGPEGGGISTSVYIVLGAVGAAVSSMLVVGLVWKCAARRRRAKEVKHITRPTTLSFDRPRSPGHPGFSHSV